MLSKALTQSQKSKSLTQSQNQLQAGAALAQMAASLALHKCNKRRRVEPQVTLSPKTSHLEP
jgi:hypothetical protein